MLKIFSSLLKNSNSTLEEETWGNIGVSSLNNMFLGLGTQFILFCQNKLV